MWWATVAELWSTPTVCAFAVNGDGLVDGVSAEPFGSRVAWYRNAWCTPGSNGTGGNLPCTLCPVGRYNPSYGEDTCVMCPSGVFGSTTGRPNATCTGPCAAGQYGSSTGKD